LSIEPVVSVERDRAKYKIGERAYTKKMARTDDNIPVDKNYRLGFCKNKFKKKVVEQAVEYRVNIRTRTWMVMLSFSAPYHRTQ
jgi:hypothetical protein